MGCDDVWSIRVTGTGSAAAPPDVVVIELAAEATAQHAASALTATSAALTRMRDAALVGGVERVDVASTGTSLSPAYDREGRLNGYRAFLGLTVRLRDIPRAGHLLADLVAAGGDEARLQGTRFEHSDPEALAAAAREAAFADARDKAQQYAGLAGRALGPVLAIDEGGRPGPAPMPRDLRLMAEAAVPVESGVQAVTAAVTVCWELV
jgi:hypothetical protein